MITDLYFRALNILRIYKLSVLLSMHPMPQKPEFETVEQFITFVGRERFQTELEYSTQLVHRAIKTGLMPAPWFIKVRALCNDLGVMTPEHLFRWEHKRHNKQNVNSAPQVQGATP